MSPSSSRPRNRWAAAHLVNKRISVIFFSQRKIYGATLAPTLTRLQLGLGLGLCQMPFSFDFDINLWPHFAFNQEVVWHCANIYTLAWFREHCTRIRTYKALEEEEEDTNKYSWLCLWQQLQFLLFFWLFFGAHCQRLWLTSCLPIAIYACTKNDEN